MKTVDISRDLTVTFDEDSMDRDTQWSISAEPGIDTRNEILRVLSIQKERVSTLKEALRHCEYNED